MNPPNWVPDWSKGEFLGLAIWQWLGLFLSIVIAIVLGMIARVALSTLVRKRMVALHERMQEKGRRGIGRPTGVLIGGYFLTVTWTHLGLPEGWNPALSRIAAGVVLIGFLWLCLAIWDVICDDLMVRSSSNDRAERLLIPLTRKLVRFLVLTGGVLLALAVYGVNVTGLLAGLGIGGLVVALAAKDSVENVFGSLTVLLDMPFSLGDWVKIGDVEGVVEEINLRSTRIRTFADSVVTLPNSNLIKASVENLGRRRYRRTLTELILQGTTPIPQVESFLAASRQAIADDPLTVKPQSSISLTGLRDGNYTLAVVVYFEVPDLRSEQAAREAFLLRLARLADEHRVDLGPTHPLPPR